MMVEAAIRECLRVRHRKDLIVEECKDGPTTMGSHLRMDLWAMPRSWTRPACTAYEIKVNRSDFLRDDKWHGYLDLCHQFYFVCPANLIAPDELPESAGLVWLSKTGTKLYTKRKAPQRDVTLPETLWRYILMCRARIESDGYLRHNGLTTRERWEKWLEDQRVDREFGRMLASTIRRRVEEEVLLERRRNDDLNEAIQQYEQVHALLIEVLGEDFPLEKPPPAWSLTRDIKDLSALVPDHLRHSIKRLATQLDQVHAEIERLTDQPTY